MRLHGLPNIVCNFLHILARGRPVEFRQSGQGEISSLPRHFFVRLTGQMLVNDVHTGRTAKDQKIE